MAALAASRKRCCVDRPPASRGWDIHKQHHNAPKGMHETVAARACKLDIIYRQVPAIVPMIPDTTALKSKHREHCSLLVDML